MRIWEIERLARPGAASRAGFIGIDQGFLDVLTKDNTFVKGRHMTHQQLAEPLFYVMNLLHHYSVRPDKEIQFRYKGTLYKAFYVLWMGSQESIFNDGLQADKDYIVTNMDNGASLGFSELLPPYIERYGFYEGNTSYRVDPQKILDVFFSGNLEKKPNPPGVKRN